MKYFWGKRIKHSETSYFKKNQRIGRTLEPDFKVSNRTTQTNSFSKLCSSLQTVTHKQEFNSSCLFFLHGRHKKDTRDRICPEYFKGRMHCWCFLLFGFFLFVFWGLTAWWVGPFGVVFLSIYFLI